MNTAYTVYWSYPYCAFLRKVGAIGAPLRFLWGGHNQNTNYTRMKVRQGDIIYPITVRNKALFVIARMQVEQKLSIESFNNLFPEYTHLITNTCAREVLLGENGTTMQLSQSVPEAQLSKIHYCSGRGMRGIKSLQDGRILFSLGLQGVYRLCPETAYLLNQYIS